MAQVAWRGAGSILGGLQELVREIHGSADAGLAMSCSEWAEMTMVVPSNQPTSLHIYRQLYATPLGFSTPTQSLIHTIILELP